MRIQEYLWTYVGFERQSYRSDLHGWMMPVNIRT